MTERLGGARSGTTPAVRLELSRRGDYAVRAMLALAREPHGTVLSATTIAREMRIPARFVAHVLTDLSHAGLVVARTGRGGGYRLARPAAEIDLLRIVDAAEDKGAPRRCVIRGDACDPAGRCAVHEAFDAATVALRQVLANTMLSDLGRPPGRG